MAKEYKDVFEFQKAHPTRTDRENALRQMSNAQIDKLAKTCGTIQGKVYISSFKKGDKKK